MTSVIRGDDNFDTSSNFWRKNAIINGNFDVWQRGTSSTSNGIVFIADRWYGNSLTGNTVSHSQQGFTLGQTDVPNNPKYFWRTSTNAYSSTSDATQLAQKIESAATFAGKTATLSFWAKADGNKDIAIEFIQYYGSGGSPSTWIKGDDAAWGGTGVHTISLTTSWQKFEVQVDVPSLVGKTLGTDGNDYLGVIFWMNAGSNNDSRTNSLGSQAIVGDIAQVQLEEGPVATRFEQLSIGEIMALCQRYYTAMGTQQVTLNPTYNSTTALTRISNFHFPVEMRAVPTVSNISSAGCTATPSAQTVTTLGLRFNATGSGAATHSYVYDVKFDAEL